jgi:phosphopantetheine adenylyltransferase
MKEVAVFGGDLSKFAPPEIVEAVRTKIGKRV